MARYDNYNKEYTYLPQRYTKNSESRTEVTEDGLGLITLVETQGQGFHYKFTPIRAISAMAPNIDVELLEWNALDASNQFILYS